VKCCVHWKTVLKGLVQNKDSQFLKCAGNFGLYATFEDKVKCKKIKLSLCLTKHYAMKTYWWSGGIAPCILTSALDGVVDKNKCKYQTYVNR
jgi:hypothetical protein